MSKSKRISWHLEKRKLSELKPYDKNPRIISSEGLDQLGSSFDEIGMAQPININTDNTILSGHARYQRLLKEGAQEVDVYVPDRKLTPKQEEAVIVRMNKNVAGVWDYDSLANNFEIEDLIEWGFTEDELDIKLEVLEPQGDEDAVPEVPKEPVTRLGDIWLLGKHRVMCGDSTNIEAVEKLMQGQKADMVFTDPPYGMNYSGRGEKTGKGIMGDTGDPSDFYALTFDIPERYVWGRVENFAHLPAKPRDTIIWKKNNFGMGRGYRGQYECCFYYGSFNGSDSDVWEAKKDSNYIHPTQKPVELCERAIKNSQPRSVLDAFMGSGSTLIACEKTNRTCYGMELDPHYVDVICQRWQDYTGKEAVLESSGESFKVLEAQQKES